MTAVREGLVRALEGASQRQEVLDTGRRCVCWLCGHRSVVPLPLSNDQTNFIECERCEVDNAIPGEVAAAGGETIAGQPMEG